MRGFRSIGEARFFFELPPSKESEGVLEYVPSLSNTGDLV